MNDSTTTSPVKCLLQEFLEWLETAYGNAEHGAASEFAHQPLPGELAMAEVALVAAVDGDRPVLLATSSPMECVIAGLVLKRAGVSLDAIFEGGLTDEQFQRLADSLMEVKMSKLLIESPDGQPGSDAGADY